MKIKITLLILIVSYFIGCFINANKLKIVKSKKVDEDDSIFDKDGINDQINEILK